jgi:FG-GAP repeat/FG-GAP-like repeat
MINSFQRGREQLKYRIAFRVFAAFGLFAATIAFGPEASGSSSPPPSSSTAGLQSAASAGVPGVAATRKSSSQAVSRAQQATFATAATPLPVDGYAWQESADMAVDDANRHVFISGGDMSKGLAVADFSGNVVAALETGEAVTGLAIDPDAGVLYAGLYNDDAVAVIDLVTLAETKRWPSVAGFFPRSLALVDGKLLISAFSNVFGLDLTNGETTSYGIYGDRIKAVAGHPTWAAIGREMNSDHGVEIADFATDPPTVLHSVTASHTMTDMAVSSDGKYVLAGGSSHAYSTSDLSSPFSLSPTSYSGSAAGASANYAIGRSTYSRTTDNLFIYPYGVASPMAAYNLSPGPMPHGLMYSGDGTRLFVVVDAAANYTGKVSLLVLDGVDRTQTNINLALPTRLMTGKGVSVHGAVTFTNAAYDGQARTLHVTRTDKQGTVALPNIVTDTSGAFTLTDSATTLGKVTYTFSYDGDATFAPVTKPFVGLREAPWDVNGDGYSDLVVGSPGEDLSTHSNTGEITILYGHASGVSGTGSVEIDQDTAGVPGGNESGDQFGYSTASGDFNADGYADVAVSANAEDLGSYKNTGAVWIFYGSATGLRTSNVQMLSELNFDQNAGVPWTSAYFGETMAAGDFDGDGADDLAITAGGHVYSVTVSYGSPTGLTTPLQMISGPEELWGTSLSAGDINGDGRADLAVGAPLAPVAATYTAGDVQIFYGSINGLANTAGQTFNKATSGVPGSPKGYSTDAPDEFGWQVVLADFNGDGKADLAVSAPGAPVTYNGSVHQDAGTVTILYSNGSKIGTTGAVELTQATSSVPGSPGKGDEVGVTMATGDSNNDGKADLAIYSPGDHYVTVIRGGSSGLAFATSYGWTQNSPGVPGSDEAEDRWGDSLRFANFKGAGPQGLAVGADGENSGAGAVTVLYATSSGLTGTGSVMLTQDSSGVPGGSESGDFFGSFFSD